MSDLSNFNGKGQTRLESFVQQCTFIDLEADGKHIFQIGAIRGDATFERKGRFNLKQALEELDQFVAGSRFVAGHNLIEHDWPILRSIAPTLELLRLPVIDTLYLSPLAFPENPYHALIKDYKLVRDAVNNPVADARLSAQILADEWQSFRTTVDRGEKDLLSLFRFCLSVNGEDVRENRGMCEFFELVGAERVEFSQAKEIFCSIAEGSGCKCAIQESFATISQKDEWAALAYCAAWLRVAGGNSVIPPWVRYRFPDTIKIIRQLREVPCSDSDCRYCKDVHDPCAQLKRYFGFSGFRENPAAEDGTSLQEAIVRKGMGDQPLLAILPTGGGKSLCYQLPALVRNFRRGVLTIVISPLQALMKDQVDNLAAKTGTPSAAALCGMLTPPERGEVLERTRLGDIAILYVSPEQLRNKSFREAIAQREIGCWVFDEAHCLSKWGHDFRPDYLYASRFIREFSEQHHTPVPPVACFTATAKCDVIEEIVNHFQENLGQSLEVFRGSFERENLRFEVQSISLPEKFPRIHDLLAERLGQNGSAVVYAATRRTAEDVADFLSERGWRVRPFHAGLTAADKREIQDGFIRGNIQVICATNAFGMGIDKDDVRVVVHADMPGSLENYLQEAGRAGRDAGSAECVLLFDEEDVESQFRLASMSQLVQRDLIQLLRALRRTKRTDNVVVVTSGELLQTEQTNTSFDSDDNMADTKVKTAVAWLERAGFLERNENQTNVFQGKPLVLSMEEAERKIDALNLPASRKKQWLAVLAELMNTDSSGGLNADQLAQLPVFKESAENGDKDQSAAESISKRIICILHDMAETGIVQQGLLLSAFVRHKIADSSRQRLEHADAVETAMLKIMQEESPDAADQSWLDLSLRRLNQAVRDCGLDSSPEMLRNLLSSLSRDGKGFAESHGTVEFRHSFQDHYRVKLKRDWPLALEISRKRRDLATVILEAILAKIPSETPPSKDFLVEFSSDEIAEAIRKDLILSGQVKDMLAAIDRGLMYLHEQKAVILQHGLAVFRQAMTIELLPQAKGRRYTMGDFDPLSRHYEERVLQVHVMAEYAKRSLDSMQRGLELVTSYFNDPRNAFVARYFADRTDVIKRAVSHEAYQTIVDNLRNPVQIAVVAGDDEKNSLILAGPGSGKTKVVVHRVAYLVQVKRVPARSILVICFNRQAAMQLRNRLNQLIGTASRHVAVLTYHSLAMRLTGTSFAEQSNRSGDALPDFDELIPAATRLLRGETSTPGIEADELRDRLLAGYSHILVDEYQDIDAQQYDLISALADRTGKDPDTKLAILAVGDDDQNIYAFRGANVEFIRRFEKDYNAQCHYLVENYRSTNHVITVANQLISKNLDRMKTGHPIQIDRKRSTDPLGGEWEKLDPVIRGKVQILEVNGDQSEAVAIVDEMQRLKHLQPKLAWSSVAVLSRKREFLYTVRAVCEQRNIPVRLSLDKGWVPKLHRVREIAAFLDLLEEHRNETMTGAELLHLHKTTAPNPSVNPWSLELCRLLQNWKLDTANASTTCGHVAEYIYESLAEQRREQTVGHGVFLSTVHAAKGLEFNHVLIPNSGWMKPTSSKQEESERRLFYVGMTRACKTLTLIKGPGESPFIPRNDNKHILRRSAPDSNIGLNEITTKKYEMLGLNDMYLDFASLRSADNPIHAAIAQIRPGDYLNHRIQRGNIELLNEDGRSIARLAQAAAERWQERHKKIKTIRVIAIIRRDRKESKPEFSEACRCDRWEVPLVEIAYTNA